jgi:hypothetical protein
MTPEQKQTLNDLLIQDSIQTIWLALEAYLELKDLPQSEDEEEWQEICEAMARIEGAI